MIEWVIVLGVAIVSALLLLESHGIVLAYHSTAVVEDDIYTIRPKRIMRSIYLLKCLGYQPGFGEMLSADNIVKEKIRRWLLITFDDAYRDNFHFIIWLLKHGYRVVVFMPTAQLGQTNAWDKGAKRLMTFEEAEYLAGLGAVFASHGHLHQRMTQMPSEILKDEILTSRAEIQKLMHGRDDFIAYPYGDYNDNVLSVMKESGVQFGFSTIPRSVYFSRSSRNLEIGRLSMRRDWTISDMLSAWILMRLRGWKQIIRSCYD